MNFDVLNKTEILFNDLLTFYYSWNADPETIIDYLIDQPQTKRRMQTSQQIRRMRFEEGLPIPPAFKFDSRDIYDWVYFDRLIPLQENYLTSLDREVKIIQTDAEERSRLDWCRGFQQLLSSLSIQLSLLEKASTSRLLEITDTGEANWQSIQTAQLDISIKYVKPLIANYSTIINRYLPASTDPKDQRAHKESPQSAQGISRKYSQFSDLFKDKTTMTVCIDALRKIDFPTINEDGQWIGGSRRMAVIVAWIERMEHCNFIDYVSDRKSLVTLLNNHFPNLNMGGEARTFRNRQGDYNDAKTEFAALLLL